MVQLFDIQDVKEDMKDWSAIVTVEAKNQPGHKEGSPNRYQKYVFGDSKGAKVEGVVWNENIEILSKKLQLFKKCKITNARVKSIPEAYQRNGIKMQWTLNARTPIKEIEGEIKIDTSDYKYVAFDDLAQSMDNNDKPVDIVGVAIEELPLQTVLRKGKQVQVKSFYILDANMKTVRLSLWDSFPFNEGQAIIDDLKNYPVVVCRRLSVTYFDGLTVNTRFDTIMFVNPAVKEAIELKNWARKNSTAITDLVANKGYKVAPDLKMNVPVNITSLANVDASETSNWVKVLFNFKNIPQKYWYMACPKCHAATEAPFEDEFDCNICEENQKAAPRCRLDTDLVDDSDIVPATLFGDFAEKALKMQPVDVMNSTTEALESHVAALQLEFDEKMLIVKIKPAKTTRKDFKQHYIVTFYSEDHSDASTLDSTALNLHEKFNEAAEGELSNLKSSKRSVDDIKKQDGSEMTKKSRSKRN